MNACRRWVCVSLAVLAVLAWAGAAEAAGDKAKKKAEQAKTAYATGKQQFDAGHYPEALEAFEQAYALSGKPDILYNLGLTAELQGELPRAVTYLERYLEQKKDAPDAQDTRARITALKARLVQAAGPTPAPLPPPPAAVTSRPPATPLAPVVAASTVAEGSQLKVWPIVVLSAGGLLLITGTFTAVAAAQKYNALKDDCAPTCSDTKVRQTRGPAIAADVQLGVGAAVLVTGVVLLLLDRLGEQQPASAGAGLGLAASADRAGAGLALTGEF